MQERKTLSYGAAFRLLREHARRTNRKVVDVAGSILESHQLLSKGEESAAPEGDLLTRTDEEG